MWPVICVLYESGVQMICVTKAAIVRFSFSAFKESVATSCALVVLSVSTFGLQIEVWCLSPQLRYLPWERH